MSEPGRNAQLLIKAQRVWSDAQAHTHRLFADTGQVMTLL